MTTSPSEQGGLKTYGEGDFVDVVDTEGRVSSVPERWIGTDLLPVGTKKATKSDAKDAATVSSAGLGVPDADVNKTGSTVSAPVAPPADPDPAAPADEAPGGNATREEWAAYAVKSQGATEADLVDADGKELGRDALREKYAPKS